LGYAKHDYQGKADKETLDDLINHHTDDDLLEGEVNRPGIVGDLKL